MLKALEESYRHTYSVANLAWHGTAYIAFSTGMGDGTYPVYVGSSSTGSPVTVVVDCETSFVRLGLADELARHLGAPSVRLSQLRADNLTAVVRTAA